MNKILVFSLFFLVSCAKSSWSTTQYQANYKSQSFLSSRYDDDRYPDISVEFISTDLGVQCYLEIQRGEVKIYQQIEHLTEIFMEIDEKQITSIATILKGGQRILLDQKIKYGQKKIKSSVIQNFKAE